MDEELYLGKKVSELNIYEKRFRKLMQLMQLMRVNKMLEKAEKVHKKLPED